MYKLSFRSNKPEAEAFTNKVADEILPSIRKTGGYSASGQPQRVYVWTAEAEQLRRINMKEIRVGYFSISAFVLQKLIYVDLGNMTPNERAKIDISFGKFFPRWLKGDRKGQLKDCTVSPEHPYDKSKVLEIGHVVRLGSDDTFPVCHYANLYAGDRDNFWELWYSPVILPVYFNGKLPDGLPLMNISSDIQNNQSSI